MKYFFILGTNPTLSLAEISNFFPKTKISCIQKDVAILETDDAFDAQKTIKQLGGIIKIGQINAVADKNNLLGLIIKNLNIASIGKFKFGFSYYGKEKFNIKPLAMELKKYLRAKNISCRWVTSKEKTLSSVVVGQNKLTSKGVEIVLINTSNQLTLGQTLAVQPFKDLSFRDYNRPARDSQSGMLPPKLAQIMLNLSHASHDQTILDPFCGSGTIITEAMLMGYQNLIGADISKKAVEDTKANIEWTKKNYPIFDANYQVYKLSATDISKKLKPNFIDAIITEPYLGPQRGKVDIDKTKKELEPLYTKTLNEFAKILKPKGRIIIIFPYLLNRHEINPNLNKFKIINPLPYTLQKNQFTKLTARQTIVYGRPGQKVWREIVVLEK